MYLYQKKKNKFPNIHPLLGLARTFVNANYLLGWGSCVDLEFKKKRKRSTKKIRKPTDVLILGDKMH